MSEAVINITVPTFGRLEMTRRTLISVKKHTRTPHVVTVVDNGSTDGTPEVLIRLHEAGMIDNLVLFRRNMGVACAANMGFDVDASPLYMKLDNDMEVVKPDWLGPLVALWCDNPEMSLIGPKLPGSGHPFETVTLKSGVQVLRALSSLSGAALMVSREAFLRLGYFCEDYGLYGEEDADYSHRAKEAGFMLAAFEAHGVVEHLGEWNAAPQDYVAFKKVRREKNTQGRGISLFRLNCYLYNHRLLPLFVPRRYRPVRIEGPLWDVTLDPGYVRRRQFVSACKQVVDAFPEAIWDEVQNDPEIVARLREIKADMGLADPSETAAGLP